MEQKQDSNTLSQAFDMILQHMTSQDEKEIVDLISVKIKEVEKDIYECNINEITKKLGVKANSSNLKKTEVDFKLRQIMLSILKRKSFHEDVKARMFNPFKLSIGISRNDYEKAKEYYLVKSLEELIYDIIMNELFTQVKKNSFVIKNVYFQERLCHRIKVFMLKRMKYSKISWKGIILSFIKDLVISIISNIITHERAFMNRRYENYFLFLFIDN